VHFAHLSGNEPGEIEAGGTRGVLRGKWFVRWPDHSGSWHNSSQLRHACAAYNPNKPAPPERPNYADLPFDALEEVCLVFQHGAGKYGKDDWAKPDNQSGDHVHKALGHLIHHLRGKHRETGEGGSGYRHLSHAVARLLMAIGREIRNG